MVVLEVGVIFNGLPVFRVDYHQEVKGDPTLRSGMFTALQLFAKEAFADDTEELRLKNFVICVIPITDKGTDFILYAVSNKETKSTDTVRSALKKVDKKLMDIEKEIDTADTDENTFLLPIFGDVFKDLRLKKLDRAKKLF